MCFCFSLSIDAAHDSEIGRGSWDQKICKHYNDVYEGYVYNRHPLIPSSRIHRV